MVGSVSGSLMRLWSSYCSDMQSSQGLIRPENMLPSSLMWLLAYVGYSLAVARGFSSSPVDFFIWLFTTWQLAKDQRVEPKRQGTVFYNQISKVIYYHFCHRWLLIEINSGAVWEETLQGCEYQEVGIPGAILEAGYHNWHKCLIIQFLWSLAYWKNPGFRTQIWLRKTLLSSTTYVSLANHFNGPSFLKSKMELVIPSSKQCCE